MAPDLSVPFRDSGAWGAWQGAKASCLAGRGNLSIRPSPGRGFQLSLLFLSPPPPFRSSHITPLPSDLPICNSHPPPRER
eukprot:9497205-Pyramimonas_sp.AAC.1